MNYGRQGNQHYNWASSHLRLLSADSETHHTGEKSEINILQDQEEQNKTHEDKPALADATDGRVEAVDNGLDLRADVVQRIAQLPAFSRSNELQLFWSAITNLNREMNNNNNNNNTNNVVNKVNKVNNVNHDNNVNNSNTVNNNINNPNNIKNNNTGNEKNTKHHEDIDNNNSRKSPKSKHKRRKSPKTRGEEEQQQIQPDDLEKQEDDNVRHRYPADIFHIRNSDLLWQPQDKIFLSFPPTSCQSPAASLPSTSPAPSLPSGSLASSRQSSFAVSSQGSSNADTVGDDILSFTHRVSDIGRQKIDGSIETPSTSSSVQPSECGTLQKSTNSPTQNPSSFVTVVQVNATRDKRQIQSSYQRQLQASSLLRRMPQDGDNETSDLGSEASSSQAVSEGSERSSPLREEQPVTPRQPEEFDSHNASIPQCMPNYQLAFRQLDSDAIKHLNKHFVREISVSLPSRGKHVSQRLDRFSSEPNQIGSSRAASCLVASCSASPSLSTAPHNMALKEFNFSSPSSKAYHSKSYNLSRAISNLPELHQNKNVSKKYSTSTNLAAENLPTHLPGSPREEDPYVQLYTPKSKLEKSVNTEGFMLRSDEILSLDRLTRSTEVLSEQSRTHKGSSSEASRGRYERPVSKKGSSCEFTKSNEGLSTNWNRPNRCLGGVVSKSSEALSEVVGSSDKGLLDKWRSAGQLSSRSHAQGDLRWPRDRYYRRSSLQTCREAGALDRERPQRSSLPAISVKSSLSASSSSTSGSSSSLTDDYRSNFILKSKDYQRSNGSLLAEYRAIKLSLAALQTDSAAVGGGRPASLHNNKSMKLASELVSSTSRILVPKGKLPDFYLPTDPTSPHAFTVDPNRSQRKTTRAWRKVPCAVFLACTGVLSICALILYIGCMTPAMRNGIPEYY